MNPRKILYWIKHSMRGVFIRLYPYQLHFPMARGLKSPIALLKSLWFCQLVYAGFLGQLDQLALLHWIPSTLKGEQKTHGNHHLQGKQIDYFVWAMFSDVNVPEDIFWIDVRRTAGTWKLCGHVMCLSGMGRLGRYIMGYDEILLVWKWLTGHLWPLLPSGKLT